MAKGKKDGARSGKDKLAKSDYEARLEPLQIELDQLARWLQHTGKRMLVLIEGRDTAGKGGVIAAISDALSPRQCRTVALAKPSEREGTQWYFQRYVRAPAGRRRTGALRSQLVQPRRRRGGDGLLQRAADGAFPAPGAGVREAAGRRRRAAVQVLAHGRPGLAGGALRRAPERPAEALEAVADGPAGARQVRGLRHGARAHAEGHAHARMRRGRW